MSDPNVPGRAPAQAGFQALGAAASAQLLLAQMRRQGLSVGSGLATVLQGLLEAQAEAAQAGGDGGADEGGDDGTGGGTGDDIHAVRLAEARQELLANGFQLLQAARGSLRLPLPEGLWLIAREGGWLVAHSDASGHCQILDRAGEPQTGNIAELLEESKGAAFGIRHIGRPDTLATGQGYWEWAAELLRGRWPTLLGASLFVNLGMLSVPLFAMLVYDKVVHNGIFETLWALAIGVFLFLGAELVVRQLRVRQVERLAQALDQRVDRAIFASLLASGSTAGSRPGLAARFLTLYRDLAGARDFFSAQYLLALADLPFVIVIWLVIGLIAWPLLLVLLAWSAFYVIAGAILKNRAMRVARYANEVQAGKFALLTDAFSSLDALRTSHAGLGFQKRFADLASEHSALLAVQRADASTQALLSQGVFVGTYVCVLVAGAYLIFEQGLSLGALIAVAMLSGRTLGVVGQALTTAGRHRELRDALAALDPFIRQPAQRQDSAVTAGRPAASMRGEIKLIGIEHAYGNGQQALANMTLGIAAGERVALLGRPGSGKSTLARIIAGAIAPTQGEVRIDDSALASQPLHRRAGWLSFKPQEATLVAGSVEENILAGLSQHASDDERAEALKRGVYLSGLDADLQAGLLSLSQRVEEYGSNLSGGQRQKIALARALAVPARVLILDEPTGGLDPESERVLVERLKQLTGVTLVLVTHSARALSLCERVVALDRGRMIADGATRELVKVDRV